MIGQKKTVVEDGSRWAINPTTFKRGYICFGTANKVIGEQILPVSQPMPDVTTLPDKGGFEWQEQWSVNMKCLSGADAGIEVVFKTTTVGGIQAVAGLIETIRDRLNGGSTTARLRRSCVSKRAATRSSGAREDLVPGVHDHRLDVAQRSGDGTYVAAAAAHVADVGCRAAAPPPRRVTRMRT